MGCHLVSPWASPFRWSPCVGSAATAGGLGLCQEGLPHLGLRRPGSQAMQVGGAILLRKWALPGPCSVPSMGPLVQSPRHHRAQGGDQGTY